MRAQDIGVFLDYASHLVKVALELHCLDLLDLLAEAELLGEPVEAGVGGGQVVDGGPRPPDGVRALGALRPDREFDYPIPERSEGIG